MKLFNSIALMLCISDHLALPPSSKALTTEQAEVGGMLAGVMCLRSKNLIDESTAKTAIRTTIESEGYSLETVGDKEVKEFAMKMLKIISKDENCGTDL
jgi:hypothetical protein